MSDLLALGSAGLRAYRASLGAVGDNIANANTDGYKRRHVQLAEVSMTTAPNILYRNRTRFDGVEVEATVRATDIWRTADARLAAAEHGRTSAVARWLATAETALGADIAPALGETFAAAARLSADPAARPARVAFLQAVDGVASTIQTSALDVARVAQAVGESAQAAVEATNADLVTLAAVNLDIRRVRPGTTAFAELADRRDLLLDAVATRTGAAAAVSADGSARLIAAGATLLDLGEAASLALIAAADDRLSFSTSFAGTTAALVPASGSLSGLARAADTIADRRAALDQIAGDFAATVNAWHAAGRTPSGTAGAPLLALSASATTLTALATDPGDLAAAAPGGPANGNALALADVRRTSGVEASLAALIATHAGATAAARTADGAARARRDGAAAARDVVEGVDLDREAADLLRFQQAYEAAARVVQIARETVDTILALFR